jgi:uncharacterized damage-inducible protein DinB
MPTRNEVVRLFAYNRWANARALEPVSALTPEEFGRTLGGGFPSIHETLAHIYAAEWVWLGRWKRGSPRALPTSREVPTLEALREKWAAVESEARDFVERVTQENLDEVITYVNVKGETWSYTLADMFVHVVNHSTYHRGQVATMLRQLGKIPLSTDFLVFHDEGPR